MKKITRTISGVTPVAVMMKPWPCPHGKCIYCPAINSPNSYTDRSPPVIRAKRHNYDPYKQVLARLKTYELMGHSTSKVELILMGGTFSGYPKDYREWFIKRCFDAFNGEDSETLEEAQKKNEKAKRRVVTFTIEDRPDYCTKEEINEFLRYGVTRVEIGVQSLDEKVLEFVKRGHGVKEVIEATQLLKDSGFKVYYHMMPGLFSNIEKDVKMFKELFEREEFRPDGLKIYPTVVVKGTGLEKLWKEGKYKPYTLEETIEVLARIKEIVPKYVRIARVMRAFSKEHIVAGVVRNDLRYLVKEYMKNERGTHCSCIRCREVGYKLREGIKPEKIELYREDYKASGGHEIFLSYEDIEKEVLIGLLRLRIPYRPFRPEIDENTAIVRELHVYGSEVDVGKAPGEMNYQHRGFGKKLMEEAERIAKEEFGMRKIVVISGIGVREYFYRLGYKIDGPYVSKML